MVNCFCLRAAAMLPQFELLRLKPKMPRRKCVFNKNLEATFPFLEITKSTSDLHCLQCGGRFSIASGGRSDILTHLRAKKHIRASKQNARDDNSVPVTLEVEKSSNIEICRLCKKYASDLNGKNLFHKDQEVLITKIMELTSTTLRNEYDLPCYVCQSCEEQVKRAYAFRTQCRETFAYFDSIEYKNWFQKKSNKTPKSRNGNSKPQPRQLEEVMVDIKEEEANSIDSNENDMLALSNESDNSNTINDLSCLEVEFGESTNLTEITSDENNKTIENKSKKKTNKYYKKMANLICEHCGNHFTSSQHFITHLRRHMNNKPYKCEVCPKQCYTSTELKRHMRRHTGEKPFVCKHCQRRFTDQSTRIKHERMHTNERPFSCSQCLKAFSTSYGLKNHMLVHTGERSFKCAFCNKAFQRKTHLTTHNRSLMHKQNMEKQRNNQESPHTELESESTRCLENENFDIKNSEDLSE